VKGTNEVKIRLILLEREKTYRKGGNPLSLVETKRKETSKRRRATIGK